MNEHVASLMLHSPQSHEWKCSSPAFQALSTFVCCPPPLSLSISICSSNTIKDEATSLEELCDSERQRAPERESERAREWGSVGGGAELELVGVSSDIKRKRERNRSEAITSGSCCSTGGVVMVNKHIAVLRADKTTFRTAVRVFGENFNLGMIWFYI